MCQATHEATDKTTYWATCEAADEATDKTAVDEAAADKATADTRRQRMTAD